MSANPCIFITTAILTEILGTYDEFTSCSFRLTKGSHKSFKMMKLFLVIFAEMLIFIILYIQFIINTVH